MALIKCPECGKEISDKAFRCIHCGYPLKNALKQEMNDNKTNSVLKPNNPTFKEGAQILSEEYKKNSIEHIEKQNDGNIQKSYDKNDKINLKKKIVLIVGCILIAILCYVRFVIINENYIEASMEETLEEVKLRFEQPYKGETIVENCTLFGVEGVMEYRCINEVTYNKFNECYWFPNDQSKKDIIFQEMIKYFGEDYVDWGNEHYSWPDQDGFTAIALHGTVIILQKIE